MVIKHLLEHNLFQIKLLRIKLFNSIDHLHLINNLLDK